MNLYRVFYTHTDNRLIEAESEEEARKKIEKIPDTKVEKVTDETDKWVGYGDGFVTKRTLQDN